MAATMTVQFDEFQTRRIERVAGMMGLAPETFSLFSILKATEDVERLERIVRDPDLKAQLRDVCDLRKLGKLTPEDFEREVAELLSMPEDDQWGVDEGEEPEWPAADGPGLELPK
jgi:hypothetical protein